MGRMRLWHWIALAAVGAALAGAFIGRDEAYQAMWAMGAILYSIVAWTLWPLVKLKGLPEGLFGIAACGSGLFLYKFLYISLGRPPEWFNGWQHLLFLACAGGILASMTHHVYAIGDAQGRGLYYLVLAGFAAIAGLFLSVAF